MHCVLSFGQGLGKTVQTIAFLVALIDPGCRQPSGPLLKMYLLRVPFIRGTCSRHSTLVIPPSCACVSNIQTDLLEGYVLNVKVDGLPM